MTVMLDATRVRADRTVHEHDPDARLDHRQLRGNWQDPTTEDRDTPCHLCAPWSWAAGLRRGCLPARLSGHC